MPSLARVAGIAIPVLGVLWLTARFLVWEPDGLQRGSLTYELKIPARAKAWPLWQPTGDPLYDFRHADGEARGYTNVHYTTALQLPALRDTAQRQGYVCTEPSPSSVVCDLKQGDVSAAQVTAEPTADHAQTNVSVSIFED
jgi:hypothetical protein